MKTMYDVQQLLKRYGIFIYVGKRLWDIELMLIELKKIHEQGLIENDEYMTALLILKQEHRIEESKENQTKK
ncbi:MAG: YqgQ family protein [Carnobacterium sp.]|uniref:YqgQ family protein n=1 Tax=unclassified Carnobacterium TaxID=257487 RepID=UPI0019146F0F|nr:YqgQ family protein [Carnobacterium sp. CS13]QQP69326.1 YqgQ family protein [Carnobacterium sp. CS13]